MMLIDTNVFIDHLRNYPPAVAYFSSIAERDDVLYSAITEVELLTGTANNDPSKRETLVHFLHRWTKVSLDNPLAIVAGDIARAGVDVPDAIIAASALANGAQLVTRNVKHFRKVSV